MTVHTGRMQDVLQGLSDNSIDACITDPPYELGFMGKSWDKTGVAFDLETWKHVLRVLKPGAYLLAFGGTRTHHRIACAIEGAGFQIKDSIAWMHGQGFPKSLDISKAIDAHFGVSRETVGQKEVSRTLDKSWLDLHGTPNQSTTIPITEPATDEARQWDGWGTALKPSFEPIILAQKPREGTYANNVLKYGVGGLNVDAGRIERDSYQITNFESKLGS